MEITRPKPLHLVTRATDGYAFAGVSSISGRGIWLAWTEDTLDLLTEAVKQRKDSRWLKLATRYAEGQSVAWKTI